MKKKKRTPTPHDAAFRQFLAHPEIARDFMLIHLPPELRAVCDLSTLKLESGSFVSLVHYILQAGETSDAKAFVRELAQRMPQQGDELMTIAEQLKQEGIEKGIQLGRQEGRNEGKLEVAQRLLKMGMPTDAVQ